MDPSRLTLGLRVNWQGVDPDFMGNITIRVP
jgi:hypothetical protein